MASTLPPLSEDPEPSRREASQYATRRLWTEGVRYNRGAESMTRSHNLCPHLVLMLAFRRTYGLPGKRAAVERHSKRLWAWPFRPPHNNLWL